MNLTQTVQGVQLEEISKVIQTMECDIFGKYKMLHNPKCKKQSRCLTIPYNHINISDDYVYEYFIDIDKLAALIYVRRNSFNTADITIVDLL